eukprot:3055883-Rhodomonas_salina.1
MCIRDSANTCRHTRVRSSVPCARMSVLWREDLEYTRVRMSAPRVHVCACVCVCVSAPWRQTRQQPPPTTDTAFSAKMFDVNRRNVGRKCQVCGIAKLMGGAYPDVLEELVLCFSGQTVRNRTMSMERTGGGRRARAERRRGDETR